MAKLCLVQSGWSYPVGYASISTHGLSPEHVSAFTLRAGEERRGHKSLAGVGPESVGHCKTEEEARERVGGGTKMGQTQETENFMSVLCSVGSYHKIESAGTKLTMYKLDPKARVRPFQSTAESSKIHKG